MATIAAIRDGIKARLATISGLKAFDTWPDQIPHPAAIVKPVSLSSKGAMGDGWRVHRFEITLLAAPLSLGIARAQDKLDAYLDETGASSVIAALDGSTAGRTLGGIVTTLDVEWSEYGTVRIGPFPEGPYSEYAGVRFDVTIWP